MSDDIGGSQSTRIADGADRVVGSNRGHATSVTCTWILPAFDMPVRITINSFRAHLRGKHRTEPVPPETNRLITVVDAALGQQVLDLAQR